MDIISFNEAATANGRIDILDSTTVKLTGDQTIEDVKTFTSSPIVPTPTADFQTATKKYVDDATFDKATTVNTVADMEAISSPIDGQTCIVKDLDRGGIFIYDSTKVVEDNQGTNFNGWIRQYSVAVNVKWFGAKGDGITDDTEAIQKAFSSLRNNSTIDFQGGKYLISYNGIKNTFFFSVCTLTKLNNVTILGNGSEIIVNNHNVDTYGGLLFLNIVACKNIKVSGFYCNMSFIGRNDNSNFYPESGFLYAHNTLMDSTSTPEIDKLEDIEVFDCKFNIRSEYGAYCTTTNPYEGDYNNGGKYYSVFIRGASSETNTDSINKKVSIHNLYFFPTHESYCIWVWAFSNVRIFDNIIDGVAPRISNVSNVTLGGSVPAIRCHRFYGKYWKIYNNTLKGRKSSERVGSKLGACALIGFAPDYVNLNQDDNDIVVIQDNRIVIGSMLDSSTEKLKDIGIQILCSGNFDINNNIFSSTSDSKGSQAIALLDYSTKAGLDLKVGVTNNIFDESCDSVYSLVYVSEGNTDNERSLKYLDFSRNRIDAYYISAIDRNNLGGSKYGVNFQNVSNNIIKGNKNRFVPYNDHRNFAIVLYNNSSSDYITVTNNNISWCYNGIVNIGAYSSVNNIKDNIINVYNNKPIINGINYISGQEYVNAVYSAGSRISVQGDVNSYYKVDFIEFNTSIVNIGTLMRKGGDLLVASSSNTWNITQTYVGQKG